MRLVCTNCDAEYEVPDDAIPAEGRDVQCSNCGHTWFVASPNATQNPAIETEIAENEQELPRPSPQREVPEEVRTVLQEEAARELAARQADAQPDLEMQPDLGIQEAPKPSNPPRTPPPRQKMPRKAPTQPSSLQDIDEGVKRSLANIAAAEAPKQQQPPKSKVQNKHKNKVGFRIGFVFAILLLGTMTAIYLFASDLTQTIPEIADLVNNYVLWVNDLRANLHKLVQMAVQYIQPE